MKLLLGAILVVALLVIGFCIARTYKEKNSLAGTVRAILFVGLVIVFFNIVSLFTQTEIICLFAYSMYFMASDWLLYYLFKFSMEYIGNKFEDYVKKGYMVALLVADSISMLLNNVVEHSYSLRRVELFGGEVFYELEITPIFFLHYGIIFMLVIFVLISLFYRAFTAPKFYRNKYLLIGIITVVLIVLNIMSVTSAVDISVMGYIVEAVCLYYCAFHYTPQKLLPVTLSKIADDLDMGIYLLDIDGNKMYKNKMAKRLMSKKAPLVKEDGTTLEQWCMKHYNEAREFSDEKVFYRGNEERILRIDLRRTEDENNHIQGGYFIISDRTEEIDAQKREAYIATHDTLTGLYNKEYFLRKAEQYIKKNPEEDLYMICTDIKEFKMINDLLGTEAGDKVLVNFARKLDEYMDKVIVYGRLGNDIFGILISKGEYKENYFLSEGNSDLVGEGFEEITFPIVNYVGIYEIRDRMVPVSVMCDRARMAIATIKGDYQKRVAYYDIAMRDKVRYEQELISGLSEAIENEQLKMYLQPQTDADGKMLGAEALIRWEHPTKGFIMPGSFIPVFEKNGLISEVDKYIWEVACRQLRKWKDEGRDDLYISVNISPRDFYFLNIYQIFTDLVKKYDIDAKSIRLEITETAVVMDIQRQTELINKLRAAGFIVEMDDFGSGYSSLNMLKDIHVDVLKIDMAFLKKSMDEERSKKILEMIILLSKNLDMPVITEGVETVEQVDFLSKMGCEMFQGYFFAKPMPVTDFEKQYL